MSAKIVGTDTIPSQDKGDDLTGGEVVDLKQSLTTKAKVFFGTNKKLFVGLGTGLALGVVGLLVNSRLASRTDEVDETPEA
jgi:hypothetical protein